MAISTIGQSSSETQAVRYGQLSKTNEKRLEGNFKRRAVTYEKVELHYGRSRLLPVILWNKKTVVKDVRISNPEGLLLSAWDKRQVKNAIKEAWQQASPESVRPNVRMTSASVSTLHPARSRGTMSNSGTVSTVSTVSALSNVSDRGNVKNQLRLSSSQLDKLASQMLPVLKQGFGVPKVTQEVPATSLIDPAVNKVVIEIVSKNGHVFDLSYKEVKKQVQDQLMARGCVHNKDAVNDVMSRLYEEATDSDIPPAENKKFDKIEVFASISGKDSTYQIDRYEMGTDDSDDSLFNEKEQDRIVAANNEGLDFIDKDIDKMNKEEIKFYVSEANNEIEQEQQKILKAQSEMKEAEEKYHNIVIKNPTEEDIEKMTVEERNFYIDSLKAEIALEKEELFKAQNNMRQAEIELQQAEMNYKADKALELEGSLANDRMFAVYNYSNNRSGMPTN